MSRNLASDAYLLDTLLLHTDRLVVCLDRQYRIVVINAAALAFYRWDKSAVMGKSYTEVCQANQRALVIDPSNRQASASPLNVCTKEWVAGAAYKIQWTVVWLDRIVMLGKPVSEKEDLQAYLNYLDLLAECMPGHFYWKDQAGRYLGCNTQLLKTTRYKKHEIVGRTDKELWSAATANKFTQDGAVRVTLTQDNQSDCPAMLSQAEETVCLVLQVVDSGIGIPKERHADIFGHFSRLHPAYEGVYSGSGLGLYAVKQYVSLLHGRIEVESVPGEGSTFTVRFPVKVATSHAALVVAGSTVLQSGETGSQSAIFMP